MTSGSDRHAGSHYRLEPYLDLIDLYASRVARARTVVAADTPPIHLKPIGRRDKVLIYGTRQPGAPFHDRRWRFASALAVVLILCALLVRTTLAEQQYHVQDGDTITSVSKKFGVSGADILAASSLDSPEHLYPGQELTIPGIADGALGTGFVAGTYEVIYGDTIGSIAWDLHVNPTDLLEVNRLSEDDIIYPGQILIVPESSATRGETLAQLDTLSSEDVTGESEADSALAAAESAAESDLPLEAYVWVPGYVQQRNLSCEYASLYIATSTFGEGVPEWAFWESIPVSLNPHYGYRGNIDGWWGNYDDYGIYPEALVPVLNAHGFGGDVFYGDYDPAELMRQLALGRPVVVWLAMWGDTGIVYEDEGSYTVFAGEHVMTAYGYDQGGVSLSDPATGTMRYLDWGTFLWMWGASDGMSLAVYPL
jgi:LysM repeat protein